MARKTLHGFIMREAAACGRMKPRTWWPDIQDRGRLPYYEEVRDYVAQIITKEGVEAAHRACDAFERNIGLDRAKLYAAASIVAAAKVA